MHIHADRNEDLYKYVPQDCLPSDYGGSLPSVKELHGQCRCYYDNIKWGSIIYYAPLLDQNWKTISGNGEFFAEEEKRIVDESKRPGKPKNVGDIFGIEGSFKKLDID